MPNCCDRISSEWEPSMGEVTTIGLDLAKHVFQVHGVDAEGATVLRKQLRRAQVLAFFSRLPPCLVGLEACATAHYWGRELRALGHEVRLMPAQYVKAYIKRNKHDVILATGAAAVGPLLQATRTVPIVFVIVSDPVGGGFVASLARPGGNVTGFTPSEYGMSVKWLELLKEIAPSVTRVAVLRDASLITGGGTLGAIQAVAPSFGAEPSPVDVRDAAEIERAITAFARSPNSGLIVTGSAGATVHRNLIITLAAQHKLPAIYFERFFIASGGLISYGPDYIDQYRQAAGYVDRILKG